MCQIVCVCVVVSAHPSVTTLYKLYIYLELNRNKEVGIIADIITLVPLKECLCDLPCCLF